MISKKFKITNDTGVHARPATSLVNVCMQFDCDITLEAFKRKVDFKSIMGVMSLGIYSGVTITVIADGPDEEECIKAIAHKILELNLGKEA